MNLDQEPGASHPRETTNFIGNELAEAQLATALAGGRLHHAWLLTGPKGIGKATLAYRFARVALGAGQSGPRPLDVVEEDPVTRMVAGLAHPDLFVLRRGLNERGRPRSEIGADEARTLGQFFSLKSALGGRRVAIIDTADDLNRHAANAILKTLEEPPPGGVLLLLSHAPGGLLPTIRSRCRRLDLRPLSDEDVRTALSRSEGAATDAAAVRFAGGRPGRAIALTAAGVGGMHDALLSALTATGRRGGSAFLAEVFQSGDRDSRFALFLDLAQDWLKRAAAFRLGLHVPDAAERKSMGNLGTAATAEKLAEAHAALVAMAQERDGLDMDVTHAFARAARILERAVA